MLVKGATGRHGGQLGGRCGLGGGGVSVGRGGRGGSRGRHDQPRRHVEVMDADVVVVQLNGRRYRGPPQEEPRQRTSPAWLCLKFNDKEYVTLKEKNDHQESGQFYINAIPLIGLSMARSLHEWLWLQKLNEFCCRFKAKLHSHQ